MMFLTLDLPSSWNRANLREQITWCHPANDEDTQMMAEDALRMSLAKAKHIQLPEALPG